MRLVTLNAQHGRAPADGRVDTGRLARALASLDADVLALQEVDRGLDRSHRTDQAEVAAVACDAVAWRFASGAPGPAATGIALVSRVPVSAWREVRLPAPPVPVPHRAPTGALRWAREDPRVVLCARLESAAGPLTVAVAHLSGVPGRASAQLRRLVPDVLAAPGPLVLLGDLGAARDPARTTGLSVLAGGTAAGTGAGTAPGAAPGREVDHVLGRGVRAARPPAALALPVSEHRALVVDVEVVESA